MESENLGEDHFNYDGTSFLVWNADLYELVEEYVATLINQMLV